MTIQIRYAQEVPEAVNGRDGKDGESTADAAAPDPRQAPPVYRTGSGGVTVVCNLKQSRSFRIKAEGGFEIAFAGVANGDKVSVSITQDGTGGHTATFADTIRWANGGVAPTLTATGNKRDTFGFEVFLEAGLFVYDGFVIGQDI